MRNFAKHSDLSNEIKDLRIKEGFRIKETLIGYLIDTFRKTKAHLNQKVVQKVELRQVPITLCNTRKVDQSIMLV